MPDCTASNFLAPSHHRRDRRDETTHALPPARHRRDTGTPSTRHVVKRTRSLCRDLTTEVLSHRYGTSCTRKGCVYRHPPKPPKKVHVPKTSEICVHYVSGCCSFAEKCHMRHPGKAEAQKFRGSGASIACRFGVDCGARTACMIYGEW